MLRCGLVGLPNVGKSSLFNKIANANAPTGNYPFCTIDSQDAMVTIPDFRLKELARKEQSAQTVESLISITDIAGLVEGASAGKGMGNKFLNDIRSVDLLLHVVRTFVDDDVCHVKDICDPKCDLDTVLSELIYADCQVLENMIANKKHKDRHKAITSLLTFLSDGNLASKFKDIADFEDLRLLTAKPMIVVSNGDGISLRKQAKEWAVARSLSFVECSALSDCFEELMRFICIDMGLEFYFTAGPKEARSWMFNKGSLAPVAAGKIHTDFQKKFIRAQVVNFKDYERFANLKESTAGGKRRTEGKKYVVKDGDIITWLTGA